ncbi:MAG TPA: PorV/PorQ family protein [bacterium]|mgnify:CR=1 FL=1|nr:PorV/PorQ family protein [bacterium]HOL48689.1 PorV/PorQ family protein [bacterium]HPQ19864.1 PorV/PorQ family protein [bacterium]
MKKIYIVFVVSLLIFSINEQQVSAEYSGVTTAAFLRIIPDAKSSGFGRAFTGIADNDAATFFNPAALAFLPYKNSVSFTHHLLFEKITKEYISVKVEPIFSKTAFALSGLYINYDNIKRTTYTNPTGSSDFSANEAYLMFSIGQMLDERIAVGGNLKLLQRKIAEYSDNGVAADFSVMFRFLENNFNMGLGIFNIGPKLSLYQKKEHLPLTLRYGMGLGLFENKILLGFDLYKVQYEKIYLACGVEFNLNNMVFLRAGYNTENDLGSGFSIGVGFQIDYFNFDYSYEPNNDVDDAHYFTLSYKFGESKEKERKESKSEKSKKSVESVGGGEQIAPIVPVQVLPIVPQVSPPHQQVQTYEQPYPAPLLITPVMPAPTTEVQTRAGEVLIFKTKEEEERFRKLGNDIEKLKKYNLHCYFANEFYKAGNYEDALLEIKLANNMLVEFANAKLEIILLFKLDFIKEGAAVYYQYIKLFPQLENEIKIGDYIFNNNKK